MVDHSLPSMPILFKFGAAEHLRLFRERGLLHMKTLRYFAQHEGNSARYDSFEGTSHIIQPWDVGDFIIEHSLVGRHVVDPKELAGPVMMRPDKVSGANVFCMFGLMKPQDKLLSPGNLAFGDSFVLIRNTSEFLDRIAKVAKAQNLGLRGRMVEYFDEETYSGPIGPFLKPLRFSSQQEFRLVVTPGIADFRELIIGNIEDIATPVLPHAEIDNYIDFTPAAARAAGL